MIAGLLRIATEVYCQRLRRTARHELSRMDFVDRSTIESAADPPGTGEIESPDVTNCKSANGAQQFLGEFGGPKIGTAADPGYNRTLVEQTIRLTLAELPPHRTCGLSLRSVRSQIVGRQQPAVWPRSVAHRRRRTAKRSSIRASRTTTKSTGRAATRTYPERKEYAPIRRLSTEHARLRVLRRRDLPSRVCVSARSRFTRTRLHQQSVRGEGHRR